jgi:ribose transport system permease protein
MAPLLLPYLILVILCAVYVRLQPGAFSREQLNITAAATVTLLLVATGQTIVILRGGIDLSVGGVISMTTAIAATHFGAGGSRMVLWGALIIALGMAAGALNGVLLGILRLQPFIVTLATWSIWSGVALWVLPTEGGTIPQSLVNWANASFLGLGTPVWIVVVLVLFWAWFKRTRLGIAIASSGSSERSAYLSGVPMLRTLIGTYTLSGFFAALAGLFLTTQTASGSPSVGNDYILSSVAAVVIGGTSLFGGRGGLGGTIAGAFILTMIGNVIFVLQLSADWTPLVEGVLLILAVVVNSLIALYARRDSRP